VSRVNGAQLMQLAETMGERERVILETTGRVRLMAGKQAERLFFPSINQPASRARAARRILASLNKKSILFRLERRIGGVRAGSAGHVYGLGPVGKRLVAYWQGEGLASVRTPYEPGLAFVRHTLAVTEQYVLLKEAEQAGGPELLAFDGEPDCWSSFPRRGGSDTLKPDALVRLGVGEFEERSFLEVDCGTEGRGALTRKCRRYGAYFQTGIEQAKSGVFPRVVWITTNQARVKLLEEVCASLAAGHKQLFTVGTQEQSVALLSGANSHLAAADYAKSPGSVTQKGAV
jgi:Replication-relaxation